MTVSARILRLPVLLYRLAVSPFSMPCCRYVPTCSAYALEAVERHGMKGLLLTAGRLLRCHPFCRRDRYDPVPERCGWAFACAALIGYNLPHSARPAQDRD